jgi:hypothetical protein
MEDREVLLGHPNHSIAEHYGSADAGRLLMQANLILNREETRTVLRVAPAVAGGAWFASVDSVAVGSRRARCACDSSGNPARVSDHGISRNPTAAPSATIACSAAITARSRAFQSISGLQCAARDSQGHLASADDRQLVLLSHDPNRFTLG